MNTKRPPDRGEPLRTPPGLSPVQVVAALDRAWQAIRVRHQDVPPVVLLLGPSPTRPGAKRPTRGHFLSFAWSLRDLPTRASSFPDARQAADPGGENIGPDGHGTPGAILRDAVRLRNELFSARPEVFIATELLAEGAAGVFGVLLHEAAHAVAAMRGTTDTSRQGRYHNGRFKLIAEEVGLAGTRDPEIGWSFTTLSETTARDFKQTLEPLEDALRGLCGPSDRAAAAAVNGPTCGCGQWLPITRRRRLVVVAGTVMCTACTHVVARPRAQTAPAPESDQTAPGCAVSQAAAPTRGRSAGTSWPR